MIERDRAGSFAEKNEAGEKNFIRYEINYTQSNSDKKLLYQFTKFLSERGNGRERGGEGREKGICHRTQKTDKERRGASKVVSSCERGCVSCVAECKERADSD